MVRHEEVDAAVLADVERLAAVGIEVVAAEGIEVADRTEYS
jgi:hypothetical protein